MSDEIESSVFLKEPLYSMKIDKKKVLVIDDHELVRKGLIQLINGERDMVVCGEASSIATAKQLKQTLQPDICIIDISLPDGNGLDLINNFHQWRPDMKIIVLSMYDDDLFAGRALKNGAMGYINKQDSASRLLDGIRQVSANKVFVSHNITEKLLRRISFKTEKADTSPLSLLSDRELEVFELIGKGKTAAQIAKLLNLSVKTVDTYRSKIKQKLKLDSAAELTRSAVIWSLESTSH